jgi:hypothetical protein
LRALWFAVPFALVACSEANNPVFTDGTLKVDNIQVNLNPYNAISFRVTFTATNADSAQIMYAGTGDSSQTPWMKLVSGQNVMPVLGLLPATFYRLTLVVRGPNGLVVTPKFQHITGQLPAGVADAHIAFTGTPGPGYTLISPIEGTTGNTFAMAFDTAGVLRWYREVDGYGSLDVQMQRNGHYTIGLAVEADSQGRQIGPFIEVLPTGDSVGGYTAPPNYDTDGHEIVLTGNSETGEVASFFAYDTARTVDLTSLGGPASASIFGHSMFRMTSSGTVQFSWDTWNHYTLATDWTDAQTNQFGGDFDHPNALSLDADSNYIVSFRNMNAVAKVDRNTGAIIWQLGGGSSTLTIVNDPFGFFSGQHFARRLPNGHILMYDDGIRRGVNSRAVEYAIDTVHSTATMVWQYLPTPALFTPIVGSAQRLQNGNTVVGFGTAKQIDEVNANAQLLSRGMFVWKGAPAFYRAIRLPSLYQYETP